MKAMWLPLVASWPLIFLISCDNHEDLPQEPPAIEIQILNATNSAFKVLYEGATIPVKNGEVFSINEDSFFTIDYGPYGLTYYWMPSADYIVIKNFRPNPDPYVYQYNGKARMMVLPNENIYAVPLFYRKDALGQLYDDEELDRGWQTSAARKPREVSRAQPLGFPLEGSSVKTTESELRDKQFAVIQDEVSGEYLSE